MIFASHMIFASLSGPYLFEASSKGVMSSHPATGAVAVNGTETLCRKWCCCYFAPCYTRSSAVGRSGCYCEGVQSAVIVNHSDDV